LVVLLLLFEKSLYESLLDKFSSAKADIEPLKSLVQKMVTPELLDTIRKILVEECFRPGSAPEPMIVDSEEKKPEPSQQQSLITLLNPALLSVNNKTVLTACEPLLSSDYTSQHSDIFEDFFEVRTIALLDLLSASFSIFKPDNIYEMLKNTVSDGLGVQSSKYVHDSVKRVARLICADEVVYRMIRDGKMLDNEIKWLENQAESTHNFTVAMSSSEITRVIDHLGILTKLSTKREAVWKAYCCAHPAIIKLLYDILASISILSSDSIPAEIIIAFLTLLSVSVSDNTRKTDGEEYEEKIAVSPEQLNIEKELVLFVTSDAKKLTIFADLYVLRYTDSNVRKNASLFLKRIWFVESSSESKHVLMDLFVNLLQKAPSVGIQSSEFMAELGDMFIEKKSKEAEQSVVVDPKILVSMLRSQNRVLMEHPNASLYRKVGTVVEDSSKYLFEARPCLCCNAASTEFKTVELNSIANQMRATSTARFYRLKSTYFIKSFSLSMKKRNSSLRSVKVLNVYVNTRRVADVIDLRDNWDLWKRVQNVHLDEGTDEYVIVFPRPISAANLCLEVAELHNSGKNHLLRCPRCSNTVPDRHGVCSHCGENAYQCHNCRYIPYENFDGFFCPQCGTCRDCQFEVTLSMYESFVPEPVESDEDLKKATESLSSHANRATSALLQLYDLKTSAASLLYP